MARRRSLSGLGIVLILTVLVVMAALIIRGLSIPTGPGAAQEVCPEGNGWSNHLSPSLGEIEGAVEYCVKGGSVNSQGCEGYLAFGSFEDVTNIINGEGACGLSHWSYKIGDPTATEDPTPDPSSTPEIPTATPTDERPIETPTDGPTETATLTPTAESTMTPLPTLTPTGTNIPEPTPGKG